MGGKGYASGAGVRCVNGSALSVCGLLGGCWRWLVAALFVISGSAGAVGFDTIDFRVASGVSATAGQAAFQELIERPVGQGVASRSAFDSLINGKGVTVWGDKVATKAAVKTATRAAARAMGAAGLVITVAGIAWDYLDPADTQKQWTTTTAGSAYAEGKWHTGGFFAGSPWTTCSMYAATIGWTLNSLDQYSGTYYGCRAYHPQDPGVLYTFETANLISSCPAGTYWSVAWQACMAYPRVPATDQDLDNAFDGPLSDPAGAKAQAGANETNGYPQEWGPISSTTGPSTSPASTTTKTNPDGSTVTTTVQPTLTYSTTNNVVNVSTTTTVTTCTVANSCTTETTTESGDKAAESTDFCVAHPEAAACLKRWCDEHPNTAACQDMGELADVDLPTSEVALSWTQERTDNGSCPSPYAVSLHAMDDIVFSFQPICEFATGIRPVVLTLGSLSAALFVFLAFRRAG